MPIVPDGDATPRLHGAGASYLNDERKTTIAAPLRVMTTTSPFAPGKVITIVSGGGGAFTRQATRLEPLGVRTVMPTPSYSGPPATNCTWQNCCGTGFAPATPTAGSASAATAATTSRIPFMGRSFLVAAEGLIISPSP